MSYILNKVWGTLGLLDPFSELSGHILFLITIKDEILGFNYHMLSLLLIL